ncbi:thioredoxin fold domain-containing protein [Ramlibacter sp. MAHUQ-53]|uniref:thioredoxin fold domain-containing protein n=1 Tax=unclassified Ramlibacter TaxID=2617605 RepID=UPI00362B4AE6
MNFRPLTTFLAAAALAAGLAACKDAPAPGAAPAAQKAQQAVSIEAIAAEAKGFTVGSEMSVRRIFVFFDPQCPHCAALWTAAKPLKPQARFIWIPVGLLNAASAPQGAALLAAADPVAAMDQHEASMSAKQGGITAIGDLDAQKAQVAANTALMNRYGFGGVPVIVAKHAVTGELVVKEGAMPTPALAAALGLTAP